VGRFQSEGPQGILIFADDFRPFGRVVLVERINCAFSLRNGLLAFDHRCITASLDFLRLLFAPLPARRCSRRVATVEKVCAHDHIRFGNLTKRWVCQDMAWCI
jgi:hypothetical protein